MKEQIAKVALTAGLAMGIGACATVESAPSDRPSVKTSIESTTSTINTTPEVTSTTEFVPDPNSELSPELQAAYNKTYDLKFRADDSIRDGDFETATNLFTELKNNAAIAPEEERSAYTAFDDEIGVFSADNEGYRTAILAIDRAREGDIDTAQMQITGIENVSTRDYAQNELDFQLANAAEDAAREGDFDKANQIVDMVDRANTEDDDSFNSQYDKNYAQNELDFQLANAAEDAAREGDFDKANQIVDMVDRANTEDDDSFNSQYDKNYAQNELDFQLANAAEDAAREGDFDKANQIVDMVDRANTEDDDSFNSQYDKNYAQDKVNIYK